MQNNQPDDFDISNCYNSEDISDDELSKKIRVKLRQRSQVNVRKENEYLEDAIDYLKSLHPDWSTCEILKQARYLRNRAAKYSW